jgi:hypothetical protein
MFHLLLWTSVKARSAQRFVGAVALTVARRYGDLMQEGGEHLKTA